MSRLNQEQPACQRCVNRDEICEGYRDKASIIFRHETDRITASVHAATLQSPPKPTPDRPKLTPGGAAVDRFIDKYVVYPCSETSSPGFLGHLPSLLQDANVEGRFALRWTMRGATYVDLSQSQEDDALARETFYCYNMSLSALRRSLSTPGKLPDDHDLLTVTFLAPDSTTRGAHAQGMAQILRLRGHEQLYNARSWSLFRLVHHRVQKQQLALGLKPLDESEGWIDRLNDDMPFACHRAHTVQRALDSETLSVGETLDLVNELRKLNQEAVSWREGPRWSFKTLAAHNLPSFGNLMQPLTDTIQLHTDFWMAYEWNHHRTARTIAHEQILKCVNAALASPNLDTATIDTLCALLQEPTAIIHALAGDIDHLGRPHDSQLGPPRCRGIGGYLLLWPIRVVKGTQSATTTQQRQKSEVVFARIREYTGMRSHLGEMSTI
ncbi:hypothetical protein F4775DRAFT_587349 [Biscogniauxia sp. FL1348]|nr:hypothetical protein F4775DRAFT_587349 [Biscogniauxia sp. FL1348]